MIQYKDIIDRLTDEQKLALAASLKSLALPEFAAYGIPALHHAGPHRLNASMGGLFPPYGSAANSWDDELIGAMTGALARHAVQNSVNMIFTPKLSLKSPYREGLSEDPCLTAGYAREMAGAIAAAGAMPCAGVCAMNGTDVDFADLAPDARAIADYYTAAFDAVQGDCAVSVEYTSPGVGYETVNTKTIADRLRGGKYSAIICERADKDKYVECLAAGQLLWSGDVGVLRKAYQNYLSLKDKVEKGECYIEELTRECERGTALDRATLDEAADRAIGYAFLCAREGQPAAAGDGELPLRAARESIVLLKNEQDLLPLQKGLRLAVMGRLPARPGGTSEALLSEKLAARGWQVTGVAAGYDIAAERSDEMLKEALSAADGADAVLLFLGTDTSREEAMLLNRRSKLPANQLALADALCASGKKVIVLLSSQCVPDLAFAEKLPALLLAPADGAFAYDALCDVLTGAYCPSGRLAYTCYQETDALMESFRAGKNAGKYKVGCFVGYRQYESCALPVRYPFGFGLSYTKFAYSDLQISDGKLRFRLKNTGSVRGCETAQIYIGAKNSALARPLRELRAYVRADLAPGEEKTLEVSVKSEWASVTCDGKRVTEAGDYFLYVCSDAGTVRLQGEVRTGGSKVTGEDTSAYLLKDSNILSGGYTFGKVTRTEEKGKRMRVAGVLLCVFALVAAALLAVFRAIGSGAGYVGWPAFLLPAAVFAVGLIVALCSLARSKKEKAETVTVSGGYQRMEKEIRAAQPYELLFDRYFNGEEAEEDEKEYAAEPEFEQYIKFDSSRSLEELCAGLKDLARRRGLLLSDEEVHSILAALCSSRLLLLYGQKQETVSALIRVLGEYFGSGTYAEEAAEGYASPRDFLQVTEENTTRSTAAARAISDASCNADKAYIAALCNVAPEEMSKFFLPFVKYVNYPDRGATVLVSENGAEGRVYVPNNVWFLFSLKEGADASALDAGIADCAGLLCVEGAAGQAEEESAGEENWVNIGQIEWAGKKYSADFTMGEETCWKKIDRLEKYVDTRAGYHISGKEWGALELYSSVMLACGEEENAVLDHTLAARLVLPAVCRLGGKAFGAEGGIAASFENIFGEGNTPESKKLIDRIGAASLAGGRGE